MGYAGPDGPYLHDLLLHGLVLLLVRQLHPRLCQLTLALLNVPLSLRSTVHARQADVVGVRQWRACTCELALPSGVGPIAFKAGQRRGVPRLCAVGSAAVACLPVVLGA